MLPSAQSSTWQMSAALPGRHELPESVGSSRRMMLEDGH